MFLTQSEAKTAAATNNQSSKSEACHSSFPYRDDTQSATIQLFVSALATGICALSVHVAASRFLHIPAPLDYPTTGLASYLRFVQSALGIIYIVWYARSVLSKISMPLRALSVFLLSVTLKEELIRGAVMEGVVATAWTYALLRNIPHLANRFRPTFLAPLAPKERMLAD